MGGGEVTSAAALAPKCGPIGLPPKKVGEDIQKATSKWGGVKIEIEIAVQNRQCTVKVLPTAAPLLIEALKEGGRDREKPRNQWLSLSKVPLKRFSEPPFPLDALLTERAQRILLPESMLRRSRYEHHLFHALE